MVQNDVINDYLITFESELSIQEFKSNEKEKRKRAKEISPINYYMKWSVRKLKMCFRTQNHLNTSGSDK